VNLLIILARLNRRGGGGDFVAGFFLGGLVFGALGYVLAPQVFLYVSLCLMLFCIMFMNLKLDILGWLVGSFCRGRGSDVMKKQFY
jgi:hypothetical protein